MSKLSDILKQYPGKFDHLLGSLGFNPDGTEKKFERQKRTCPKCNGNNAYVHEKHPDTGMDEMIIRCPDCNSDLSLQDKKFCRHGKRIGDDCGLCEL